VKTSLSVPTPRLVVCAIGCLLSFDDQKKEKNVCLVNQEPIGGATSGINPSSKKSALNCCRISSSSSWKPRSGRGLGAEDTAAVADDEELEEEEEEEDEDAEREAEPIVAGAPATPPRTIPPPPSIIIPSSIIE
jgi:hypothetical protein